MSAGRNASSLLITLIVTIVLFAVFAGISSLNALEKHAYMPGFGWEGPNVDNPDNIIGGVCAPATFISGFPIANTRQAMPKNCLKDTNIIASSMNYALYFAVAAIIAVGVVESVRAKLP